MRTVRLLMILALAPALTAPAAADERAQALSAGVLEQLEAGEFQAVWDALTACGKPGSVDETLIDDAAAWIAAVGRDPGR